MEGRLNMTKSIGDDVFVPMTTTRESADNAEEEPKGWPIGLWRCSSLSREDGFMFSLVF